MSNILYLWDLAGTIFHENWNQKKSGFGTYATWLQDQLSKPLNKISDRQYEEMHEQTYKDGVYWNLDLQPGVREVLAWTKNNEAFTTGVSEQVRWRAEYLNPKVGFDIMSLFKKVNSTFDYGQSNKKTKEMLVDILAKRYQKGIRVVVYVDDKLSNCEFFKSAADELKNRYLDFDYRLYHILNDDSGLIHKDGYIQIGRLCDLLKNEIN